jgi:hypothetical protein
MCLYDDILKELKCPICNDYWKTGAIKMCVKGHTICNRCQRHIPPNARCTARTSKGRNFALENVVAKAIYLCPFAKSQTNRCTWSGVPFDIEDHVKKSHYNETVTGARESEWIRLSLSLEQPFQKAIFTLDKLFFPVSHVGDRKIHFSVFHVGHKEDSRTSSYRYDFRIQKSDDPQNSHYQSGHICINYQNVEEPDDVWLHHDSVQKYLTDNHSLSCDIKIRRTEMRGDVEMKEMPEYMAQEEESPEGTPDDRNHE